MEERGRSRTSGDVMVVVSFCRLEDARCEGDEVPGNIVLGDDTLTCLKGFGGERGVALLGRGGNGVG